jgi:hypothetical protein
MAIDLRQQDLAICADTRVDNGNVYGAVREIAISGS